jgi:hypothetical protein
VRISLCIQYFMFSGQDRDKENTGSFQGRFRMKPAQSRLKILARIVRSVTAIICAVIILPCNVALWAMQQKPPANPASQASPGGQDAKIPNDQLDSLVAPIALYPDPLLAQTLVACTYPLELVQLQQWLGQNKKLKDKALTDAVAKQSWDPSIQAMATFPDLVKQLTDNIKWTDELGNAFLAQQSDVMDAVQRMRAKAVEKGALKTTEQQKVETKVVENKTVVVVQPAKTEVVYVPSYDPVAVWGAPYYPYPPVAYPYYPAGGMLLGFGVGVAMGAAWGGGWGWNAGWGGNNDININRNNTFVNNSNRTGNRVGGANGSWQHNPAHRGGAPYGNRATANRYGGAARGDTAGQRQNAARQSQRQAGTSSFRSGNGGASAGGQGLNRGAGGGGGERIGNRQVSSGGGSGSRSSSAFSGGGSSRSAASASSSRGASSMGRSGGGSRGGGGRGGGRRR